MNDSTQNSGIESGSEPPLMEKHTESADNYALIASEKVTG